MVEHRCDICGKRIEPAREGHVRVRLTIEALGPGTGVTLDGPPAGGASPGAEVPADDEAIDDLDDLDDLEDLGDGDDGDGVDGIDGFGGAGGAGDNGDDGDDDAEETFALPPDRRLGWPWGAGEPDDAADDEDAPAEAVRFDLCPACYRSHLGEPLRRLGRPGGRDQSGAGGAPAPGFSAN